MATINKASLFDMEIVQTAKTLEALASANAPFAELEACRVKLSSLIDQKRKLLFAAPDPAHFIDEFLGSAPIEARRAKAGELAELALGAINDILESTEEYDPLDFETYTAMHEFFDSFSRQSKARDEVELEPGNDTTQLPQPSEHIIKSFADLSEQFKFYLSGAITGLVKRGFLTAQNARLLKYRLERLPNMVEGKRVIWERSATSLATAIIVADWLSEVNFSERLKPRTRDRENEKPSEIGSNYYSFLLSGFDVKVGGRSGSTYYRALIDVEDDFKNFLSYVDAVRSKRKHGLRTTNSPADSISYFFIQLSNMPEEQKRIMNLNKALDYQILEAYADEIIKKKNQSII
jgi:hypothetical protein